MAKARPETSDRKVIQYGTMLVEYDVSGLPQRHLTGDSCKQLHADHLGRDARDI